MNQSINFHDVPSRLITALIEASNNTDTITWTRNPDGVDSNKTPYSVVEIVINETHITLFEKS